MLPKISIVTPSFNQAHFLEKTICSVLEQGYPNLQYVIIDGGSTDGSVDIIRRYADRLHYWISEPDTGHADAINKGFSHCDGEIMAWINSDDMYVNKSLFVVGEIFESFPEVHWITGLSSFWDANDRLVLSYRSYKNLFDFAVGNPRWIQQESTFWRRPLWEKTGGSLNKNYKYMIDNDLWSRFFSLAELHHVETVLSGYRFHGANRATVYREVCNQELARAQSELLERLDPQLRGKALKHKNARYWCGLCSRVCRQLSPLPLFFIRNLMRRSLLKHYPLITYRIEDGYWEQSVFHTFE